MKRYIAIGTMWAAIIAGCYLGLTSVARSDGVIITNSRMGRTSMIVIQRSDGQGLGKTIELHGRPMSATEMEESAARDARWVAYCDPQIRWDGFAWRYSYAKAGCEYGRDHD